MTPDDERLQRGLDITEQLFGRRVDLSLAPEEPASALDLRSLFIEHCFTDSWTRSAIDMRTRSLITIALVVVLGGDAHVRSHVQGALNIGVTKDQVIDVLVHTAAYGGVPRTSSAYAIAKQVFAEHDARRVD